MSLVDQLDTVTDASAGTVDRHATTSTFESTNPASDAVVGVFPVHDADAVRETVERARGASERWAALGFDGRKQRLAAWRGYLARRMHELADLVHRENGKPHADAILEITLAIDHLAWAGAHARKTLGPRKVRAGMLAANHAAYLEYSRWGSSASSARGTPRCSRRWDRSPTRSPPATPSSSSRRSTRRQSARGWPLPGGPPSPMPPTSSRSSPAMARPAPRCAAPGSASWHSPARRRPAGRSWRPAPRPSPPCSWSSAARTR